jgi:hypothetical protein
MGMATCNVVNFKMWEAKAYVHVTTRGLYKTPSPFPSSSLILRFDLSKPKMTAGSLHV